MQPEDIDKLFRDRLQEHAPTPPTYLWDQLETELQPARKRPVMWLYAAAVVALLLVAGSGWLLRSPGSGAGTGGGELATTPSQKKSAKQPASQATPPLVAASKEAEASTNVETVIASAVPTKPTPAAPGTRSSARPLAARHALARTAPKLPASASTAKRLKMSTAPVQAVAVVSPAAAQPERPAAPTTTTAALEQPTPSALVATAVPTGPILVEVRRDNSTPGATAYAEDSETGHRGRLGSLLLKAGKKVGNAVLDGRQINLPKVALPEVITAQVEAYTTAPRP